MSSSWWERLTQPAFSEEQQAELRSKEYQDKMRQFGKAYDEAGAMPSYYRAKKAAEATYGPKAGQVMSQVQQDIFIGLDQASMALHRLATEPIKAAAIAADIAFADPGKYFMNIPAGVDLLRNSYELAQGDRTNKGFFESGENPVTLGQAFSGLLSTDNPDWNNQEEVDRYFESGGKATLLSGFIDSLSVMFLDPFNYVSPSKGLTKAFNKLGVGDTNDFIKRFDDIAEEGKGKATKKTIRRSIEDSFDEGFKSGNRRKDLPKASETELALSERRKRLRDEAKNNPELSKEYFGLLDWIKNLKRNSSLFRNSPDSIPESIADALDHVESILNNNPSIIPYGDDRYIEASNILYHLFDDYNIINNKLPEENIRPLNAADFDTEPRYFIVDADPWAVADGVIFNWDYGRGRWKVARTFPALTLSKIVDSASGSVENTRGLIDYEEMFPDDFGDSPSHLQMIVRRGTVDAPAGFDAGYGQTVRRGDAEYTVTSNPFSDTPIINPTSGEIIRSGGAGFFPETTRFSVLHVPIDGQVKRVVVAFDMRNRKYYALQSYTSTFRSKIDQQANLEEAEFQGILDAEAEEMANLVNAQRNEQLLDEGTIDADYLRDQDIDNLDNWVAQDEINDFAADNLFSVEDAPRGVTARSTGGTTVRQSKRKLAWTPLDNFNLSAVRAYEIKYVNPVTGEVSKVSVPANFAPTKVVNQSAPGEAVDTHAFFDSLPVFMDATKTKKGAFSIDVDGKVVPIAEASLSWSMFKDAIAESRLRVAELDENWYTQRVREPRVKPEMTPEQIEQYRSTWRARGEQTAAELAASLPKLNGKVDVKRLEDMYADTLKLDAKPLSEADAQMLERYSYWKRIQGFLNADGNGGIKTLDKEEIKRYGEMYGDENISYSRWLEDYGKQPIFYRYWFDYDELDDGTRQLTLSRREVEYDGFDDFKAEVRTGEPEVLYSRSFASEGEWRDFNIQLGRTPNSLSLDSVWAKNNFLGEESAWEMDITDVPIMGTTRGFKLKQYGFGEDKYDYAELLRRSADGRINEELRKLALAEASLASMRSRKALGSKFEDNKIAAMEDSIKQMRVRIGEHERDLAQAAVLAQNAIYRGEMQTDFVDSNWSKIWGPTAPKPELWLQAFARFIKESEDVSINFGKAADEVIESSTTAPKKVFVFGSNLAGRHGKGAALTAKEKYGAVYGQGEGLQGQSYGIPTKGKNLEVLSLDEIQTYVNNFIDFARKNPDTEFELTAIGTGLAGYKAEEIAPLFASAPDNVILPDKFKGLVESSTTSKKIIDSFRGENSFLSNMSDSPITVRGETYPTVEHAFQAAKFKDKATRDLIAKAESPAEAKKIGKNTKGIREGWNEERLSVMEEIVRAKFEQNPQLKEKLLATGDSELVEGNTWGDKFWGKVDDEGENNLGKILMKLREEFKGLVEPSTTTKVARVKDVDLNDPNVQYIGRAGKGQSGEFGNPFVEGKDGTLEEVVKKYDNWLANKIKTNPEYARKVYALKGKTIACPGRESNEECHGQSIVKAIEFLDNNPKYLNDVPASVPQPSSEVVIHSGGAVGADRAWAVAADKLGIATKAHSFEGHKSDWSNSPKLEERVIHSEEELAEADKLLEEVRRIWLDERKIPSDPYVRNLLRRNYFQVKDSEAVIAVGRWSKDEYDQPVSGGTGWAVYMGVELKKPVYFYSLDKKRWYEIHEYGSSSLREGELPPKYTTFAGIGTRKLNEDGKKAIEDYLSQFGAEQ